MFIILNGFKKEEQELIIYLSAQEVISRKVLVDEGHRQVVELEQAALWRFLWWSGTIAVNVLVDQNREDHSVSKLRLFP